MDLLGTQSDEDLLLAGDVGTLVRRYYGPVYGLVRRLLQSGGDARDATQETFARAVARLKDFDRRRSFQTWVFSIAAHHVRDLLRRRRVHRLDAGTEETLPDLSLPEAPLLRREDSTRIQAALDRLPFEWRLVVLLRFQQGLGYSEISDALGISINAVRIRTYRAIAALRKELL